MKYLLIVIGLLLGGCSRPGVPLTGFYLYHSIDKDQSYISVLSEHGEDLPHSGILTLRQASWSEEISYSGTVVTKIPYNDGTATKIELMNVQRGIPRRFARGAVISPAQ